jgi:hypothetical protein
MKMAVFWDDAPCSSVEIDHCFAYTDIKDILFLDISEGFVIL